MAGERKFIKENVKRVLLKEYLKEQTKRAGFGGVDIQRTPMGTRILLITERPGLVIGRKGSSIKALTNAIEFDFGFDKPQVEVTEVENANLSAQIMAEKLASALERGWHFRRAGHSTVRRIMDNGARGCQVIIAGKLTGQRHRTEKFKEGHIKFCGEPKIQWMEEGYTPAKLKQGVIGVKVQIMHPNARLPDEVTIKDLTDEEKAPVVEEPSKEEPPVDEDKDKKKKESKKKASKKEIEEVDPIESIKEPEKEMKKDEPAKKTEPKEEPIKASEPKKVEAPVKEKASEPEAKDETSAEKQTPTEIEAIKEPAKEKSPEPKEEKPREEPKQEKHEPPKVETVPASPKPELVAAEKPKDEPPKVEEKKPPLAPDGATEAVEVSDMIVEKAEKKDPPKKEGKVPLEEERIAKEEKDKEESKDGTS